MAQTIEAVLVVAGIGMKPPLHKERTHFDINETADILHIGIGDVYELVKQELLVLDDDGVTRASIETIAKDGGYLCASIRSR